MRKFALVPALLASVLTLFMVAPAQAEEQSPVRQVSDVSTASWGLLMCAPKGCHDGHVTFWPDGDQIEVCDADEDGRGIRVSVWNQTNDPDTHEYYLTDANGANNSCAYQNAGDKQPWNLAEKHCFSFGIYQVDGGHQVDGRVTYQLRNYNVDGPVDCSGVD